MTETFTNSGAMMYGLNVGLVFCGLFAIAAALHKLGARQRTLAAIENLLPVETGSARIFYAAVVTAELIAGLALLAPASPPRFGAGILLIVWAGYSLALLRSAIFKIDADCGCSFAARPAKPSDHWMQLMQNIGLIALAMVIYMFAAPLTLVSLALTFPLGLALIVLYIAADSLRAVAASRPVYAA